MTKLIRLPEVISRTGLRRSSIYAAIQAGTFPSQIPLGQRAVGWDLESIDAWIDARIDAAKERRQSAAARNLYGGND